MAKQVLNVGTHNNDKSGDTLRAGGLKIKANFDEIYAALANDNINISGGNLNLTGNIYYNGSTEPVGLGRVSAVTGNVANASGYVLTFPGTGAVKVPAGTTAQRPGVVFGTAGYGSIRYNRDYNQIGRAHV